MSRGFNVHTLVISRDKFIFVFLIILFQSLVSLFNRPISLLLPYTQQFHFIFVRVILYIFFAYELYSQVNAYNNILLSFYFNSPEIYKECECLTLKTLIQNYRRLVYLFRSGFIILFDQVTFIFRLRHLHQNFNLLPRPFVS